MVVILWVWFCGKYRCVAQNTVCNHHLLCIYLVYCIHIQHTYTAYIYCNHVPIVVHCACASSFSTHSLSTSTPPLPPLQTHTHLGVIHQSCAKSLDLLVGSNSTKCNLPKTLLWKGAIRNPTHHLPCFAAYHCNRAVSAVQHQTHNVLAWHVGQLA